MYRLWNMHGATVYFSDDIEEMVELRDRLNKTNAGPYRIVATIGDRRFVLVEVE